MPAGAGRAVPVVCGIIERGGRFLAALRGPAQDNAGLWEFPGGKVRRGEDTEKALARELREELGIEIALSSRLMPHTYAYPSHTIRLIPFICSIIDGEPHPHEHAAIRWLSILDSNTLAWSPADIKVLGDYCSRRQQKGFSAEKAVLL